MNRASKPTQTLTFWRYFNKYFIDYGGWKAILTSPFMIIAGCFGLVSYRSWYDSHWTEMVFQVVPNLLGFSLGTYALLFSLMSNPIKNALKSTRNSRGILHIDELNATFLHFIFMQVIAFMWAYGYQLTIISDIQKVFFNKNTYFAYGINILQAFGAVLGITIFIYSLLLTMAASLTIYRIARLSEPN